MAIICLISGFQVINNPRVVKEADAFAALGHDVTVLAALNDLADRERTERLLRGRRWRHRAVLDATDVQLRARLERVALRVLSRAARVAGRRFRLEHPLQLGPELVPLLRAARETRAELYSLHLEKALWVGLALARDGAAFSIDMEDWYSEDLPPADRAERPVRWLRQAERKLLREAVFSTATSDVMADALRDAYDCPRPTVVYNSFPSDATERDGRCSDRASRTVPSVTWFSQTIGPGRGLETLIEALGQLETPFELHVRGTDRRGFLGKLLACAPSALRARVRSHPQVPQDELLYRLTEHDIGFCGERIDCQSRDVTITNKMFEYLRAGLAVVASDTRGQAEIARRVPDAVRLFAQDDVAGLKSVLETLLLDPAALETAKAASRAAFDEHFGWSVSEARIQRLARQHFGACEDALP